MFIILKQLNRSLHLLPFFQGLKLMYALCKQTW